MKTNPFSHPGTIVRLRNRINFAHRPADESSYPDLLNLQLDSYQEFLQEEVNPDNLFEEGRNILTDKAYRDRMTGDFRNLRKILTVKDASANAAKLISNILS